MSTNKFPSPKASSQEPGPSSSARDELRAFLLDPKNTAPQRRALTLFGKQVELLQPSLKEIMAARQIEDTQAQTVAMLVRFIVVPGTEERVFDVSDAAAIEGWSFGPDLANFAAAISEMTGIVVEDEKKELLGDPLDGESSSSAAA